MDGLFDLILENPFFLVILIGGILSLLRGKSEKPEESKSTTKGPKSTQSDHFINRSQRREQARSAERVETEPINSKSIDELREEQMLRFTGQVDAEEKDEYEQRSSDRIIGDNVVINRKKQAFKKDFNKSLSKKGLVNSVIMAE